ncbi:hypothetical protein ACUWFG_14665, partial [Escherichia coli]
SIWHACPTLTRFVGSVWGPTVTTLQSGLEQSHATRSANLCLILFEKSSLTANPYLNYYYALANTLS